jgi:sulfite reductase (ferredoxin)
MSVEGKETKAQKAERLKKEKNPWACFDEIVGFAEKGYDSIPEDWLKTYFRWWGVYTQGDGLGVTGGKGGEGKATQYFMVRIRLSNGFLLSHQLRTIADLTRKYARGVGDLTVRQNIQLHWVTIEDLPELLLRLWQSGIINLGTCGDCPRNITGCPLAGIDADEIVDASPLNFQAQRFMVGNPDFYNLPRKYKSCITGCRVWCSYPEINDLGMTAVRHPETGAVGFSLRVGGGLSTKPHLAVRLNAFVQWHQVMPVVQAVTEIFRDSEILRQNRERARLKFLFLDQGWTAQRFQEELEHRLGFALDPAVAEEPPDDVYRDHVGVHPQKQPDHYYVGMAVLRGRLSADQMSIAADLSERCGSGELRVTNMQNLVIPNVRRERVDTLVKELEAADLRVHGSPFWRGTIACTGSEFCKLALTETKGFAHWLVAELEERLPGFADHLKIHVTGCPNSCGQHWIADLGIEGKKLKVDGRMVDAYYFCVGGAVGKHQAKARPIGYRCQAAEVPEAIERLLQAYLARRVNGDSFRQFCVRYSEEEIRSFLAGQDSFEPVARDLPSGPVPHGLEG